MSHKNAKIAKLIADCQGQDLDAHYLGFFACFNQGLYYEAHDVLEELWLPIRKQPDGDFYKGLIQLAGAFVHMQKTRRQPALALLELAANNLTKFRPTHENLDVERLLEFIDSWRGNLNRTPADYLPLPVTVRPQIGLLPR